MQLLHHAGIAQVGFVVLDHRGHVVERAAVGRERLSQLVAEGQVLLYPCALAVDDQHHAVDAIEQLLARGCVLGFGGDGDDLQPSPLAADHSELDGKELVAHGRVEAGRYLLQLGPMVRAELGVNAMEARRHTRSRDSPVDDPSVDFVGLRARLSH